MPEQTTKDFVLIDAIGLGVKIEQNAMAQNRYRNCDNVLICHVVAAPAQCAHPRRARLQAA